jgi:Icc-related predicted phosphoesterase
VHLPPGDVLLHTGDLVGNYGHTDLKKHMADFLQWLCEASIVFRLVVFIAGNHDTLLDEVKHPNNDDIRSSFFRSLPSNVVYLRNSAVEFEGLKIWGSPVMVCREETLGKRYISSAFERPVAERQHVWADMPSGLDVLMTHVPPRGILCNEEVGCQALAARLQQLHPPPRVHCFGHDHDSFGVFGNQHTTFINGAQEEVLRMDKGARSCAWVFDLSVESSDCMEMDAVESLV